MYRSRGAMMGSGGVTDGYEGAKRQRMMESNPYFAVSSGGVSDSYDFAAASKRPRMLESSPYFGGPGAGSFYASAYGNYGGGPSRSSTYSFPVVRLRGLPFNCDELEVHKFFAGLDVVDCLLVHKNGRFSGEAFVVFSSPIQGEFALQRNRQNMGRRYIEVFQSKKQEYYHAIADEVNNGGSFDGEHRSGSPAPRLKKTYDDKDQMDYTEVLKLRGLPYSATETDILDFFRDYEVNEGSVHIVRRLDGKVTGEAYVEFVSAEVAKKAMSKDKMTIGSRYVELFPSTPEDARRAESRFKQ
ncbi:heterogeneous nuclear ribonucleoprotein F isoform X1 [Phalaenopsis equestris]|uniref:heterogeneous nuclear ribonucleoprotein F isoform X1 n=2 Tax=Phalaenopsis equestris TaxID=78828 RepID=UPI0009E42D1E|nr:heterogeneous nuclear ribonucleoprotein F isoform X1 [Phalaenopsis equestris]